MQFTSFLWNTYRESPHGNAMIGFFTQYRENLIGRKDLDTYIGLHNSIRFEPIENGGLSDYIDDVAHFVTAFPELLKTNGFPAEVSSFADAERIMELLYSIVPEDELEKANPRTVFSAGDIPYLSDGLFILYPGYFFPYYFERHYHDLTAVFEEFGIFRPPVPGKHDTRRRFFHYLELCRSLVDFGSKYGIGSAELPAFLYGFALNTITRYSLSRELPSPRKAYFVGGGKKDSTVDSSGDMDFLDSATEKTVTSWNGNPETQPGDIVVMYCLAPRSRIHSIWRAVTPGSYDPFFHYYRSIYIGKPIRVKPVTVEELKRDPVLSQMPLVRGNMQGINGRVIEKRFYDRTLEILAAKGQDLSILPRLEDEAPADLGITNERDLETKLLEPLLIQLGYTEIDWTRQMRVRMGRGERVYPDYVIFPNEERNNESGYWIWEAKYSIAGNSQLSEDFAQARSYALRLGCSGLGLISKEGVWIATGGLTLQETRFWPAGKLRERDTLNEIFDLAGNKAALHPEERARRGRSTSHA